MHFECATTGVGRVNAQADRWRARAGLTTWPQNEPSLHSATHEKCSHCAVCRYSVTPWLRAEMRHGRPSFLALALSGLNRSSVKDRL